MVPYLLIILRLLPITLEVVVSVVSNKNVAILEKIL